MKTKTIQEFHTHPKDIPHIFRNRDLTHPANPLLKEWILFAYEHDKPLLKYIYKEQTKYVKFGGGCAYTFAKWVEKLFKDATKANF